MPVRLSELVGAAGGTVVWHWMGTCSTSRGTGRGHEKWYAGVVIRRPSGAFDGVGAYGPINGRMTLLSLAAGTSEDAANVAVRTKLANKRRTYQDDPSFLIDDLGTGLARAAAAAPRSVAPRVPAATAPAPAAPPAPVAPSPTAPLPPLPIIWPMLAPSSTPERLLDDLLADVADDATTGYVLEENLNGVRKLSFLGEEGIRFTGRSPGKADPTRPLEDHALSHLSFAIPHLAGTVVDGELIALGRLDGHSGVANARASNPDSLVIVLYDIPLYNDTDLTASGEKFPFWRRRQLLERVYRQMEQTWMDLGRGAENFPFRLIRQVRQDKRAFHAEIKARGGPAGEGTMAKDLMGLYHQGEEGRTGRAMYKLKHVLDGNALKKYEADTVIVGFTKGRHGIAGQVGAIKFGQYVPLTVIERLGLEKDRVLEANGDPRLTVVGVNGVARFAALVELGQVSGMSSALRREMTEAPEAFLGRVMTVTGSWRLPSGAIENPVFGALRDPGDKAPVECIWYGPEEEAQTA